MDDHNLIKNKNISIIGLGLIGASLAMALKGHCKSLTGVDQDLETRLKAKSLKIFDQVLKDPFKISPNTDILILAVPVDSILSLLKSADKFLCKNALLIDVGSSKIEILKEMKTLPSSFQVIGGHPICGKEKLSIDNADANLFLNNNFVLTKLERTSKTSCQLALQIIELVNAKPLWMTAQEHDAAIAFTSHAPFILASALALAVPEKFSNLASTGYKSTARLAATPSSMMSDVLLSNSDNIVVALKEIQDNIDSFIDLINEIDPKNLNSFLLKCSENHNLIISE